MRGVLSFINRSYDSFFPAAVFRIMDFVFRKIFMLSSFLRSCCRHGDILTGACALVLLVSCGGGGSSGGSGGGGSGGGGSGGSSSFSFTEISTIGTNVSGDLAYLEAGANATFSVNVSCSVSCDGVQVLFFRSADSDISPQDEGVDNVTLNGTLGRTRILPFPFTAPDAPGSYYYGVCIEGICSAALKVFVPKAKVIGVDVIGVDVITTDGTLAAGTAANFAVNVSCLASCADVDVRYFRSADGDISPQDEGIGNVSLSASPGEQALPPFPFTAPEQPGTYYYGVCIEGICSLGVKVFVPKAKVIGVDVITTDGTLAAGTAANFAVDVSCLASCADVDVRYFRSADGDISPQDTEIGDVSLSAASGEQALPPFPFTAPDAPGTYYYGVCIEDSMENFIVCSAGEEVPVWRARVTDVRADAALVVNNGTLTLTATVLCEGPVACPGIVVSYYRVGGEGMEASLLFSSPMSTLGNGMMEVQDINAISAGDEDADYYACVGSFGSDLCSPVPFEVLIDVDGDGDGFLGSMDVDDDGDGLIELWTAEELNNVRYQLNGSGYKTGANETTNTTGCPMTECIGYELAADIDLASYGQSDAAGAGWQPIGNERAPFTGIFSGNDFTINNLTINRPSENNVGLFGRVSAAAKLQDVRLEEVNVSGNTNVGGLVGYGNAATITASSVTGMVSGVSRVGGLVGHGEGANVNVSSMAGTVNGTNRVGGLVGWGSDANITFSYAMGTVQGEFFNVGGLVGVGSRATITASYSMAMVRSEGGGAVGGLAGDGSDMTIIASYSQGSVSGLDNTGGLVGSGDNINIIASYSQGTVSGASSVGGLLGSGNDVEITASYAAGGVSGNTNVGGLMGRWNDLPPTITASYWDSDLFNQTGNTLGTPQTTAALQSPTEAAGIYATWSRKCPNDESLNIWDFGTATQYPALNCPPGGLADQR